MTNDSTDLPQRNRKRRYGRKKKLDSTAEIADDHKQDPEDIDVIAELGPGTDLKAHRDSVFNWVETVPKGSLAEQILADRERLLEGDALVEEEVVANDPLSQLAHREADPEATFKEIGIEDEKEMHANWSQIFQDEDFNAYRRLNNPIRSNISGQVHSRTRREFARFRDDAEEMEMRFFITRSSPKDHVEDPEEEFENENEGSEENIRPNYFLALRITNPTIISKIGRVQDFIYRVYGDLVEGYLVDKGCLHITLNVLRLPTNDDIFTAIEAMNAYQRGGFQRLVPTKTTVKLRVQGVRQFKSRVMFADILEDSNKEILKDVFHGIKSALTRAGITEQSLKFDPHLTILKFRTDDNQVCPQISESVLRAAGVPLDFGVQFLHQLDLCAMKEKDESGYYSIIHSIKPSRVA